MQRQAKWRKLVNSNAKTFITVACSLMLLTACSKDQQASQATDKKTSADSATSTDTSATTTSTTSTNTATAADSTSTDATKTDKIADASADKAGGKADAGKADKDGKGKNTVSLNDLPNDMVIVTVGSRPLKVGDYRRMLKIQQIQMQQSVSTDPNVRAGLINQAIQRGITLSPEEKKRLLEAARQPAALENKPIAQFLKEKHATEQQYDSR